MIETGRIYNEDCMETMERMDDDSVDLVLTDPPYGVDFDYDKYDDGKEEWESLISSVLPKLIDKSSMVLMQSCSINKMEWIYNNYPPDWLICWYKGSPGTSAFIGFNDWEPILVYGKNSTDNHDYFYAKPRDDNKHPCPKSINWAEKLISDHTEEDDLVYDPFIGSGTTAVACEKLNRKWIGSEISEEYCEIARDRIKRERDQLKLV